MMLHTYLRFGKILSALCVFITIQVRNLTLWLAVASGFTLLRNPTRDFNYVYYFLNGSVLLAKTVVCYCATVQPEETFVCCVLRLFCIMLCGG